MIFLLFECISFVLLGCAWIVIGYQLSKGAADFSSLPLDVIF